VYCTLHCTFTVYFLSLSRTYESKGFRRFNLIRDDRAMKKYSTLPVSCTVSRDDTTIKIMLFYTRAAWAMKKRVIVTQFTMKIISTYLYINCNKKIYWLKNILTYCGLRTYICMYTLGAFWVLYFTMLPPVLAWRAVWNLRTLYFSGRRKPRILNQRIRGPDCMYFLRCHILYWCIDLIQCNATSVFEFVKNQSFIVRSTLATLWRGNVARSY
jgi:hypothetical protein